ncbi:MAG: hypothetical protein RIC55_37130 [Pirellulaceae bacterium]
MTQSLRGSVESFFSTGYASFIAGAGNLPSDYQTNINTHCATVYTGSATVDESFAGAVSLAGQARRDDLTDAAADSDYTAVMGAASTTWVAARAGLGKTYTLNSAAEAATLKQGVAGLEGSYIVQQAASLAADLGVLASTDGAPWANRAAAEADAAWDLETARFDAKGLYINATTSADTTHQTALAGHAETYSNSRSPGGEEPCLRNSAMPVRSTHGPLAAHTTSRTRSHSGQGPRADAACDAPAGAEC